MTIFATLHRSEKIASTLATDEWVTLRPWRLHQRPQPWAGSTSRRGWRLRSRSVPWRPSSATGFGGRPLPCSFFLVDVFVSTVVPAHPRRRHTQHCRWWRPVARPAAPRHWHLLLAIASCSEAKPLDRCSPPSARLLTCSIRVLQRVDYQRLGVSPPVCLPPNGVAPTAAMLCLLLLPC